MEYNESNSNTSDKPLDERLVVLELLFVPPKFRSSLNEGEKMENREKVSRELVLLKVAYLF